MGEMNDVPVTQQTVVAASVGAGVTFFAIYGATGSLMASVVGAGSSFFGGLAGGAVHSFAASPPKAAPQ